MNVAPPVQSVAYFDHTFREAIMLTRDVRDYLSYQEPADLAKLSPTGRLVASCESMRITSRMTQVIAWLLVQKAVHAGELDREQAVRRRYRISGQKVCRRTDPIADEALPDRLIEFLDRSCRLYERVLRLDKMLGPATA